MHPWAESLNFVSRCVLASALLATTSAHAATVVVPPNTGFFNGWTFSKSTSPSDNCAVAPTQDATKIFAGTLGANTYAMSSAATPLPDVWLNCAPWTTFGIGVPVGTGAPATVDTIHIKRGVTTYRFSTPLPVNTVYFSQDVDGGEVVNISFADCAGNPVDASGFDHLQVSVPSASLPTVTPGAASWTVTSVPGVGSLNETLGIVIKSANVCQIRNVSTAPGTGGGGGNHFFFGTPPVPVSPTAVPTLSPGMLGGMAAMLAMAAAGLGIRRRKP